MIVYIQEAHADDSWQMDSNLEDEVVFTDPVTLLERQLRATQCVTDLGIEFPAVVDTMDNATERAYAGWPERLYLIDAEGKVAYKGGPGPMEFDPTELADSLAEMFPDVQRPELSTEVDAQE